MSWRLHNVDTSLFWCEGLYSLLIISQSVSFDKTVSGAKEKMPCV